MLVSYDRCMKFLFTCIATKCGVSWLTVVYKDARLKATTCNAFKIVWSLLFFPDAKRIIMVGWEYERILISDQSSCASRILAITYVGAIVRQFVNLFVAGRTCCYCCLPTYCEQINPQRIFCFVLATTESCIGNAYAYLFSSSSASSSFSYSSPSFYSISLEENQFPILSTFFFMLSCFACSFPPLYLSLRICYTHEYHERKIVFSEQTSIPTVWTALSIL